LGYVSALAQDVFAFAFLKRPEATKRFVESSQTRAPAKAFSMGETQCDSLCYRVKGS
jgi:hypothetical protein